jgi:hypothetical protein
MGLVHATADIVPTKQELVESWLPSRPWAGGATSVEVLAGYRFDDPEGEVGIETIVWRTPAGDLLQVPLTYRSAPLAGAEQHLISTMEHTVLGTRWVYDGCADPVLVSELARAMLTGGTGVDNEYDVGNGPEHSPTSAQVKGSGSADSVPEIDEVGCYDEGPLTIVNTGPLELVVARVVGTFVEAAETLAVTWKGGTDVVVAGVRPV